MLRLNAGWRRVLNARGSLLSGRWGMLNPARSAVIGDVVSVGDGVFLHNGPVHIGGVDDRPIHMRDRGVVGKIATAPLSAGIADATVPEAVVHAAVVAHFSAPIAVMEEEAAVFPAPISGSPQGANEGSINPCAGNPVVIPVVIVVGPVAGNPYQVGRRAHGLHIHRQHRRRKVHAD